MPIMEKMAAPAALKQPKIQKYCASGSIAVEEEEEEGVETIILLAKVGERKWVKAAKRCCVLSLYKVN